jgi:pyruvate dehydrogenase E2 component (dihydrolipoamide acetyltransferase)
MNVYAYAFICIYFLIDREIVTRFKYYYNLLFLIGIYGVKSAAPIVLTPQACALALGAIVDTVIPRVSEGGLDAPDWEVAPIMIATLSCDHRVVDGAIGAEFLKALRRYIEHPILNIL